MNIRYALATLGLMSACATAQPPVATTGLDDAAWNKHFVERRAAIERLLENFHRIHFQLDSSALDDSARAILAENTDILRKYPLVHLEIEGHCDDRGAVEYNLALGQRRAEAIKKYLVSAGVASERIETISYGEERPLALGDDDGSYFRNRRAEFRVTYGAHPDVFGSDRDADVLAQR